MRPKHKGFGNAFGHGRRSREEAFEGFPALPDLDLVDPLLAELTRYLHGDEQAAKRVLGLQRKFPNGTRPELVVYQWLLQNNESFIYQAQLFGGRTRKGGLVIDFLLRRGGQALAVQVNGGYWHTRPGIRERDAGVKLRLTGQTVEGMRIGQVVEVWEDRLRENHRLVLRQAVGGVEVGR